MLSHLKRKNNVESIMLIPKKCNMPNQIVFEESNSHVTSVMSIPNAISRMPR